MGNTNDQSDNELYLPDNNNLTVNEPDVLTYY